MANADPLRWPTMIDQLVDAILVYAREAVDDRVSPLKEDPDA
jgi:hypothetical protein